MLDEPRVREALVGLGALAVFAAGAARTVVWADSAKLTIYALGPYAPSLNPGDHPGWSLLAWLWRHSLPWLGPVVGCHLLSAAAGAGAVWLAAGLLRAAGRPPEGALVLAAAHPLWWASSLAETYAPAVLLVLLTARLTARPTAARAGLAGLAAGFGIAVHSMTAALTAPLLLALPRRWWPAGIAGGIAGLAPVWLAAWGTPRDPLTGHMAGGAGSWRWHLTAFLDPGRTVHGAILLAGLLALALGPLGLLAHLRRSPNGKALHPWPAGGWAALAALAVLLSGYAPYRLHLMTAFLVTGLFLLRPPEAPGPHGPAHAALQAALYAALAAGLVATGHGTLGVRVLPHRNNAAYFLEPWKAGVTGARRYVDELLGAAPPGAVVLADFNPGAPLVLAQRVDGLRPDVAVVPTAVDEALAAPDPADALARRIRDAAPRPVVLADGWEPYYRLEALRKRFGFRLERCGPGWRVTPPPAP